MSNETKWIAWTIGADKRVDYVADLRGCEGREPNGRNSDYGYVFDEGKALALTEREWQAFARHMRKAGKPSFCCPA